MEEEFITLERETEIGGQRVKDTEVLMKTIVGDDF